MEVGLLHYAAPPVVGGVESVMSWHARLIAAAGHAVRMIFGRGGPLPEGIRPVPVPRVDSREAEVLAVKAELDRGQVTGAFESLRAALERELEPALAGLDVLIAHNVGSLHKNLALTATLHALAGRPGAPRLILWHHDLAWTTPRYRPELHAGFPWDLLRQPWPGAVQVVVSEHRRQELAGLLQVAPDTIRVVPNGIDPAEHYGLGAEARALVQALGLDRASPRLLLPVRLTPRKNVELALRVLAALQKTFPEAALIVTGPPGAHNPANAGYLRHLQARRWELGLDGRAHFLAEHAADGLSAAAVADFYRVADALFLPSREEGFGLPVLEAGLSRLPIFCAGIAPLRELAGDEAVYFDPEADPAAVAAQVAGRLAPDRAFQLASRVRGQYAWPEIYRRHIEPLLTP